MSALSTLMQGLNNCSNLQNRDNIAIKAPGLSIRMQASYGAGKVLDTKLYTQNSVQNMIEIAKQKWCGKARQLTTTVMPNYTVC